MALVGVLHRIGDEVGEKPEKPKKVKKVKEPKESKSSTMHWIKDGIRGFGSKVKNGVFSFYDEMTREEDDENNLKTE